MRKTVFALTALLAFSGTLQGDDINLPDKGIEQYMPGLPRQNDSAKEFIPFSQAIKQVKGSAIFVLPSPSAKPAEELNHRYAGFGPFPVKPNFRYVLSAGLELKYSCRMVFMATVYKEADPQHGQYIQLASLENNSFCKFEQEFITSADTDRMIFWIFITPVNKNPMAAGPAAFISNFKIQEKGPVTATPDVQALYGKNLLKTEDFQSFQPGNPDYNALELYNREQNGYQAKIVDCGEGLKALRVVYANGNYPYVHFISNDAPLYGQSARFSCRIRGKGKIRLGIWWKREFMNFYYQHADFYTLTAQWQDISVSYGCAEPLTQNAGCGITCSGDNVEFEVSRVKFELTR